MLIGDFYACIKMVEGNDYAGKTERDTESRGIYDVSYT